MEYLIKHSLYNFQLNLLCLSSKRPDTEIVNVRERESARERENERDRNRGRLKCIEVIKLTYV